MHAFMNLKLGGSQSSDQKYAPNVVLKLPR